MIVVFVLDHVSFSEQNKVYLTTLFYYFTLVNIIVTNTVKRR
jgi:hypothetical protein